MRKINRVTTSVEKDIAEAAREASMLVYGDSKWFENNNYEEICTFLRTATGRTKEEGERNDNILSFFYVTPAEQEIFIKGNWIIELEQYALQERVPVIRREMQRWHSNSIQRCTKNKKY